MRFQQLNQAFQSDPRRILGQALQQQGASSAPVRTPLQGLGRLSSALVGAYLQRKAGDAQVEREADYERRLGNALSGLDLGNVPGLSALSEVNPLAALTAGVGLEGQLAVARAKAKPTNTRRDMTPAEVAATGRDPSLGVYQIDTQGAIYPPSGSQVSGDISNRFDQINEVIRLNQKESLTPQEAMRLDLFTKDLARSRPVVVPDGAGGTVTVMQPGLDVSSITGGQTVTGDAALRGDPAARAAGSGDVAGIPGGTIVGEKPDQLTTQESEFVADAASASADLQTVIDIMFNGDLTGGEYNQSVAIASGTGVGRAASGDAQRLFDALNNLVDLRLRQRTGATANQEEVENYLSAVLPGLTTRPDTQRARVERLITELNQKIKAFKGGRNIPGLSVITIPETAADDSDEFEF
jgi:hypothetical protein